MLTINGYDIHITHYRITEEIPGKLTKMSDIRRKGLTVLPQGGATFAFVYPRGKTEPFLHLTMGSAICSERDNYNRQVGREIAVGRALKHLDRRINEENSH